jgi:hypothetical protein
MDTDKTNKHGTYQCVVRVEKKVFLPLILFAGALFCVGWYYSVTWYGLVILCVPLVFASIAVLWWPVIEPANGVLRERALLFGYKQLKEKFTPLNEFVEVFYKYTPSSGRDTDYSLGLLHKTGRKVWIGGCWNTRRAVEVKAWEISCKTNIPLKEWPV